MFCFVLFFPASHIQLNFSLKWGKPENCSLLRNKNTKKRTYHKETRIEKIDTDFKGRTWKLEAILFLNARADGDLAPSLRSSRFLSGLFPGGAEIEQASEGARLGWAKKLGRSGEGVGRKGIACDQSQTLNRTPIAHERGAIVQFDWLLVRQSKYEIRNLSFVHKPTSGTQQD